MPTPRFLCCIGKLFHIVTGAVRPATLALAALGLGMSLGLGLTACGYKGDLTLPAASHLARSSTSQHA